MIRKEIALSSLITLEESHTVGFIDTDGQWGEFVNRVTRILCF